ncbi:hypothetical protein CER18_08700 [Bartonella tribocorum]|uniref:Fimbrial protein n=2 Tax=Bartonella tribocorum TaxID=85701 RepID=A0A2N9Y8I0_9HYPH|nr:hypothetical protein CER18_08700 [Bartonella tribocorum]
MDNKPMQPSKDHPEQNPLPQDLPLDPAVERVRKKLMGLMIISVLITLFLILTVLFLIVYKVATGSTSKQTELSSFHSKNPPVIHHTLSLPKNTQILSQSLTENNLVLKVLTPDQQTKFMIYNYHTGALIAVLSLETTEEISTTIPH